MKIIGIYNTKFRFNQILFLFSQTRISLEDVLERNKSAETPRTSCSGCDTLQRPYKPSAGLFLLEFTAYLN